MTELPAIFNRDVDERGLRAALLLVEENTGPPRDRRGAIAWRCRFARIQARRQRRLAAWAAPIE